MAILNTRAFGDESILDTQEDKEFWVNIAALGVTVGVALVFPPEGITLGATYGVAELTSHNITNHNGGRKIGHWSYRLEGR